MRRTQLDRGTDRAAIRVRRSVAVAWFLTFAVALAIGSPAAAVVFSLVWWAWALATTVWLWLRPVTSPVMRDPVPWKLHRPGANRKSVPRTRARR